MMRLGGRRFDFSNQLVIMAIVNRTPDSFFDRGATYTLEAALEHAGAQVHGGADIVDVGGVKAGPGDEVTVEEELARIVPFVKAFRARHSTPLSVDTYRPAVAEAALAAGANLINDSSGLSEPEIADVVARHPEAGLVVTHHGGPRRSRPFRPDYDPDVVTVAVRRCAALAEEAQRRGVRREQLIVDPGHDLYKTTAQSLEITRRIDELCALGYPVLVAMSNKDFIGESVGLDLTTRGDASLALAVFAVLRGARIVRTHDARATTRALRMIEVVLGWRPPVLSLRGLD
ncbi:MAG TPA: dihydropteroate synthase [Euzebyales bacterium]|nr:dihydropteroate synthase [Euzebyales bacterium]